MEANISLRECACAYIGTVFGNGKWKCCAAVFTEGVEDIP